MGEKSPSAQASAPKQTKNVHPKRQSLGGRYIGKDLRGAGAHDKGWQWAVDEVLNYYFIFENSWPKVGDGYTTGGRKGEHQVEGICRGFLTG